MHIRSSDPYVKWLLEKSALHRYLCAINVSIRDKLHVAGCLCRITYTRHYRCMTVFLWKKKAELLIMLRVNKNFKVEISAF